MKVKKEETQVLNISEVGTDYAIVVKHQDRWCIMQAKTFDDSTYRLLALDACDEGNSLTVNNGYDYGRTIKDWFDKCEKMHAFKTTKEAFKFLIKKL